MTDPIVSDAVRAEILGKLGRFRLGLEKSAIHEMLTVSTSMEETLAALCRLRKDGKVESCDAGRYYLRSATTQTVSKQYPESIHQRGRRGVVKPSEEGRPTASQSTPTAATARSAPAFMPVADRKTDRAASAGAPTQGQRRRRAGSGRRLGEVPLQLLFGLVRPMRASAIVAATGLSAKQVSNHLYLLRIAGLVDRSRTGSACAPKTWWRTPAGDAVARGKAR